MKYNGDIFKKKFLSLVLLLLLVTVIRAQTSKDEFFSDSTYASGIYRPYCYSNNPIRSVPEGYKPFYISHYGRHGSRWLTSAHFYENPNLILHDAHKSKKLTPFGESLYSRVNILAKDAEGRYGALSQLGTNEQKGIAERMYYSYPEIFSTKNGRQCSIRSRSTVVPRCILSMAANNERLKELNPKIEIFREAVERNTYLNNANENRITRKKEIYDVYCNFFNDHFDTQRFISSLFTDTIYAKQHIKDTYKFIYEIYSMVAILPDMDHLNISMSDVFSKDELFILWQTANLRMYYNCGPSDMNGQSAMDSAMDLLKDMLDCAGKAIKNRDVSADFRFGHDTYIIPLLALMDIKGMNVTEPNPEKVYQAWSDFKVTPMGVNLQIVFFKNEKTGDIILKFLHCEKEVEIPVPTDIFPYYRWKDVNAYYRKKLQNNLKTLSDYGVIK